MKDLMLCMSNELVGFKNEYNKLDDSHDKFNEENEFLRHENAKLKEQNKNADVACNDECLKGLEELRIEHKILKSSLEEANKTIVKFVEGEKKLNILLNQQTPMLAKR